jgi:hypothetical protein
MPVAAALAFAPDMADDRLEAISLARGNRFESIEVAPRRAIVVKCAGLAKKGRWIDT